MKRIRTWILDDGLDYIRNQPINPVIDGFLIEKAYVPSAVRLRMFALGQLECVNCGLKGAHWHVEQAENDIRSLFNINLYGMQRIDLYKWKEVMLTWDHIIPLSMGGSDHIENAQVMCMLCNKKKGNFLHLQEIIRLGAHPHPLLIWRMGMSTKSFIKARKSIERRHNELKNRNSSPQPLPNSTCLVDIISTVVKEFEVVHMGIGRVDQSGGIILLPVDSIGITISKNMSYSFRLYNDYWEGTVYKIRKKSCIMHVKFRRKSNGQIEICPEFVSVKHKQLIPIKGELRSPEKIIM